MHFTPREIALIGLGLLVLYYFASKKSQITEKVERIRFALKKFAKNDRIWDEKILLAHTKKVFEIYCSAYEETGSQLRFNTPKVREIFHPDASVEARGGNFDKFSVRSVLAQSKKAVKIEIIHARDANVDSRDCFTACVDVVGYKVTEALVSTSLSTRRERHRYTNNFGTGAFHEKEFWTFQRRGDQWLLLCIHDQHNWKHFTELRILDEQNKAS